MKDTLSKGTIYLLLSLGAVLMLLPFIWMISSSLKASYEVASMPPVWIPTNPRWENYSDAMAIAPFDRFFWNSLIVAVLGLTGELLTTVLAAYAFSKMNFWGKNIIFTILLATMMVPSEVLLIPNFVTISNLGWVDHFAALIVPWTASVFSIFLVRQHFMKIPKQLSYAAKIDGCGDFRFLWTVMVPLTKPALITMSLLTTINSWNAFLWPLLVTNSVEMRTLPVGLSAFRGEAGTVYELLMAASVMVILPMVILFFLMQKHIVSGVSRGGIKG